MQSFSKRSSSSCDIPTRPILDDDEDVLANVVAVEVSYRGSWSYDSSGVSSPG